MQRRHGVNVRELSWVNHLASQVREDRCEEEEEEQEEQEEEEGGGDSGEGGLYQYHADAWVGLDQMD